MSAYPLFTFKSIPSNILADEEVDFRQRLVAGSTDFEVSVIEFR
jgi:hypothetical protein